MIGRVILVGIILATLSGFIGLVYHEGGRAKEAEIRLELEEAHAEEVLRLEKLAAEAEAKALDYAQQIALFAEEKNELLDQLSEEAELDPSATSLSSSRMFRLNQLRGIENPIQ